MKLTIKASEERFLNGQKGGFLLEVIRAQNPGSEEEVIVLVFLSRALIPFSLKRNFDKRAFRKWQHSRGRHFRVEVLDGNQT